MSTKTGKVLAHSQTSCHHLCYLPLATVKMMCGNNDQIIPGQAAQWFGCMVISKNIILHSALFVWIVHFGKRHATKPPPGTPRNSLSGLLTHTYTHTLKHKHKHASTHSSSPKFYGVHSCYYKKFSKVPFRPDSAHQKAARKPFAFAPPLPPLHYIFVSGNFRKWRHDYCGF
jgi:hypothetical protein